MRGLGSQLLLLLERFDTLEATVAIDARLDSRVVAQTRQAIPLGDDQVIEVPPLLIQGPKAVERSVSSFDAIDPLTETLDFLSLTQRKSVPGNSDIVAHFGSGLRNDLDGAVRLGGGDCSCQCNSSQKKVRVRDMHTKAIYTPFK